MRVVPVLDFMGGVVVRGIGGRRSEYRPIVSRLTSSSEPIAVAETFREQFGLTELYLADLDAIAGKPPALALFRALHSRGFSLWVDAGLRFASESLPLAEDGVERIVAGLETLAGPDELTNLGDRAVFSLDLKSGRPLGWGGDAWDIATMAIQRGVRRLLVLDLAQVGEGRGTGTETLCQRLVQSYAEVEISAGGGVRGIGDLTCLRACGVAAVLVASALHDGRLTRADIEHVADQGSHS
jgi:phosphoribosylformimino-5-aminoimidazole carboxamide ribotide isomerase